MNHTLKIGVSKTPPDCDPSRAGRIVRCRKVAMRERLLRFLLGEKRRLTILVPGDSVKSLSIFEEQPEEPRGGVRDDPGQSTVTG